MDGRDHALGGLADGFHHRFAVGVDVGQELGLHAHGGAALEQRDGGVGGVAQVGVGRAGFLERQALRLEVGRRHAVLDGRQHFHAELLGVRHAGFLGAVGVGVVVTHVGELGRAGAALLLPVGGGPGDHGAAGVGVGGAVEEVVGRGPLDLLAGAGGVGDVGAEAVRQVDHLVVVDHGAQGLGVGGAVAVDDVGLARLAHPFLVGGDRHRRLVRVVEGVDLQLLAVDAAVGVDPLHHVGLGGGELLAVGRGRAGEVVERVDDDLRLGGAQAGGEQDACQKGFADRLHVRVSLGCTGGNGGIAQYENGYSFHQALIWRQRCARPSGSKTRNRMITSPIEISFM